MPKKFSAINHLLLITSVLTLVFAALQFPLSANQNVSQNQNELVDVLITFEHNKRPDLITANGGEVTREFHHINTIQATLPAHVISVLENNPLIRHIEVNQSVKVLDSVPWGVDRVFGDESYFFDSWNTTMGDTIRVGVIDSGIDATHPQLNVVDGINTINDSHWSEDTNGHGTHVAGTIAALQDNEGIVGVAPNVALYAIKALDGPDGIGSTADIIEGIEWAIDEEIMVLNMSFGTTSDSPALESILQTAYDNGHILIAAAGNEGSNGDTVTYPARYDTVIAVSASELSGGGGGIFGSPTDNLASFSSVGPDVELIAPGAGIESTATGGGTETKSGTSMAAPHVAGVAALLWHANPNLTNLQIRNILQESAEDIGLQSDEQGYGMVRADLAIAQAVDTSNQYTIETSVEGGGAISPSGTILVDSGASETFTFTPDTGYEINDVIIDDSSIGPTQSYTFEDVSQNHTISVIYTQIEFTISFETYEGSSVNDIVATYEETIEAPDDPEKTGHTFEGWYEDELFENAFVFDTMPADDLTLYAKWSLNEYTITFDSASGSAVDAIIAPYNTPIEAPEDPVKEGHLFNGWYEEETLDNEFVFDTMPAENITLYADWRGVEERRITFDSMGGSIVERIVADYNESIEEPETPQKEGHTFKGWYTSPDYEEIFEFDTMPAEDITLYAKWEINEYTIAFETDEASEVSSITAPFGSDIEAPDPPEKEHYIFKGWYEDENLETTFEFDTMPAEDITLYASWEPDTSFDTAGFIVLMVIVVPISLFIIIKFGI